MVELFVVKPTAHLIVSGLKPTIPDTDALYIAIGILGATVMPHSVYLHPTIVQNRRAKLVHEKGNTDQVHRIHLRLESVDTVFALIGAMFIRWPLQNVFGDSASVLFGIALIAAGLSSSLVATMAGQTVMDGVLNWSVNVWILRSVTLLPSLAVVLAGLDPTKVLVSSQVVLSFDLPFVLIPLIYFTRKADLMGSFVNSKVTTLALCIIVGVIVVLNLWLLVSLAMGY